MKDFLKKYKSKKSMRQNIVIVLWALVMAFGINFFLLDWSDFEKNLKASVLDATTTKQEADVYFKLENETLVLQNSKIMQETKNISFSLVYDAENVEIWEITSEIWTVEILWETGTWIDIVSLNLENKNLDPKEIIVNIKYLKKNDYSQINLMNASFTDKEGNIFNLTTSWISI